MKEKSEEYLNLCNYARKVQRMKANQTICEICKERLAEVLHHKDENHNNNKNDNLRPLCRQCHLDLIHLSDLKVVGGYMPHKRIEINPTHDPKKPYFKSLSRKTVFRKGNNMIIAEVSLRVEELMESWGYTKAYNN